MSLWYPKDSGFELIAYSKADYARSEAEYVSLSACCAQVIWMRTQLLDYGYKYNRIPMYCDSKSAIAISCNPVQHSRTKHINIRYHFIKEHVKKGTKELYLVRTEYQLADLFTKALPKERFEYLVHRIVIIMAQPQRPADVHQDKLCLPNKRYALMDANKKIDLDNPFAMIYLGQFWHTLQEGGSKYRLKFMLDRKEITMTLNDFRRIFHLPQATDNNHERFVVSPKFSEMVPFFLNTLGFTLELRSSFNFKTTGLVQPWQTLGKIFARCLITRVNGQDQLPLQIMQMLYCFVNNIHVDYVDLLGARDKYNNLEDDVMVKNIFNSGKHKNSDGMTIPSWMITDEMKLTNHYRMYATVFGVDVPMTQTQPIESTQGTHRTTSATTIRLHTIQLSLAKQKSHDELEAKQNVQKVEEHLIAEEIEKLVEGLENVETVEVASSTLRKNDNPIDLGTRLEPRSDKESPEVEITADAQHVNVNEEEEESIEDDYELKRMEKGKEVEETRNTPSPTTTRSL
ncbi:hypothetical protein Tco_0966606 [Tanacetum coccineum]